MPDGNITPFPGCKMPTRPILRPVENALTYWHCAGDLYRREAGVAVHHMTTREARRRQREHEQVAINAHIDRHFGEEDVAMKLAEEIEAACAALEAWPGQPEVRAMFTAATDATGNDHA